MSQSLAPGTNSLTVVQFENQTGTTASKTAPEPNSVRYSTSGTENNSSVSFGNPNYGITPGGENGSTMTDPYKEFDKSDMSPIVPEIRIRNYTFRVREAILAVVAVVGIVACLVLIGIVAHDKSSNASSTSLSAQQASQQAAKAFCLEPPCLKAASYAVSNMNTSVKPCDDFFMYACGNFPTNNPLDPDVSQRTVFYNMYDENEDKLRTLLEAAPKRTSEWSAEKKLKDFYMSCIDDYGKMMTAGKAFIEKVINPLGGWQVLNTFQESSFNFQNALQKTSIDFWTAALFTFRVATDQYRPTNRVIEIDMSGMGMSWTYYIRDTTQQVRNDYKTFIRTVAQHLAADSGLTLDPTNLTNNIEAFVADAFDIEFQLANITNSTVPSGDPHNHENKISLGDLTQQTGSVIDFVSYFQYMFGTDVVNSGTLVVLRENDWLRLMLTMVNNIPAADKARKLHNYMLWRLAQSYAKELSWTYVHAAREFFVDRSGAHTILNANSHCLTLAGKRFTEILGALYVNSHFAGYNKNKAEEIVTYVKQALVDSIDSSKFMDAVTKQRAKNKLQATTDKMGYPDMYMQETEMDNIYQGISINRSDYFQNLLNLNLFEKKYWRDRLQHREDRSRWRYNSFETFMTYSNSWNQLLVPAGMLQFPVYDWTLPHYYNFGAIGTLIGHFLVHAIDHWGSAYQANGSYSQSWYTEATAAGYQKLEQCFSDAFDNKTMGPYKVVGQTAPQTVRVVGRRFAWEGLAETSGVKLAYKAYKKWISDKGHVEKLTPTPHYNNDQSFFLTFAQTNCYVRTDALSYNYASRQRVSENVRTNTALSLLDEFTSAFGCPANSNMNADTKCDTY